MPREPDCPIVNFTKLALFAFVVSFVLVLPLGDPNVRCGGTSQSCKPAGCCFCSVYKFLLNTAVDLTEILDALGATLRAVLYDLKLKTYRMLEIIDGDDLCTAACRSCEIAACCTEQGKKGVGKTRPNC